MVDELVAAGTTVLLTTQYLEEADRLAHRIAVVNHGRVIAEGTAEQLKRESGPDVLSVWVHEPTQLAAAAETMRRLGSGSVSVDPVAREVSVPVDDGAQVLARLVRQLDDAGVGVGGVQLRRPSLDEVFLALTPRDAVPDGSTARLAVAGRDA